MKNIKDFEKFVNETYINDGGELVDSDGHETEVISSESNDDDFTKVEHSEGLDIEITKKECDEKNPKKCEEYDVVYTKKNNDVTYIIYGSLVPYETGRTTNYKFIPDDFEDQESEDYYDENSEEIEDEIILNEDVNNSNNDFTEAMNALNQAYNLVAKARNLFLKSGMTANEDVTEMLNYFETTIQKISGEMQNIIYFNRQNEPIDY